MAEADGCIIKNMVDDCYDAHHGQTDCSLTAYNKNDQLIGFIDYSIFEEKAHINMIQTHNDCKRKGIATALLQKWEGDHSIVFGFSTRDGAEFIKAYQSKKK